MIKFFRKIRYDLMTKNKTGRYLKYAIGEIILVVIGILLALGINNWNNERQLNKMNKVFLSKMLKDLDANEKRLDKIVYNSLNDNTYPSLEEAIAASDSVLKLTYLGLNESHFNYLMSTRFSAGNPFLNLNDNTYSELSNTGKLYALGSDTLVEAITSYYKRVERESDYNLVNSENVREGLSKFRNGFGKLRMDYYMDSLNFNLKNYHFYFDKNSKEYNEFQIGMAAIRGGQYQNMIKMKELFIETNILRDLIKKELEND